MKELAQPLPIRIVHWVMVTCITVLLLTGFYLHSPPLNPVVRIATVRTLHFIFSFILLANFAGHVYFYLATKSYNDYVFRLRDVRNLPSFLKYYTFVTDSHPNFGKYNPAQKLLFTSWWVVILTVAVTGSALYWPYTLDWLARLLGGLHILRCIHYFVAVYLAVTIPFHVYFELTEDPARTQAIFTGYIKKK